ncbi:fibronectin type III domain-containing protein [Seonamhaeicola sp. MEBiC1930]|uniref:fibronectin type III domain-containing protein n=1 Tax=Seonamhaeicola sp. MEBiC01930 TaxID=2976768 RepID=UPI003250C636
MKKFHILLFITFLIYNCTNNNEDNNKCNVLSNITSKVITHESATINWSSIQGSFTFEIEYKESGFTQGTGNIISLNDTNYTLSNLNSSTTYDYYIRALCEENGYGDWLGPFNITTPAICIAPIDLVVTNIKAYSNSGAHATINWSSDYDDTTYEIKFRLVGEADDSSIYSNHTPTTTANTFIQKYLLQNSEHVVYVRTYCNEDNYSDWSEPVFFRTLLAGCTGWEAFSELSADNITENSANISWNANEQYVYYDSYNVEYGISGFTLGQGTSVSTVDTNYNIDNLPSGTQIDFYVRGECSENNFTSFEGPFTFATQNIGCAIPMDFEIYSTGTDGTLFLQWFINENAIVDVLHYEIAYVEKDVPFSQGATTLTIPNDNTSAYLHAFNPNNYNLLPETTYQLYLRSVCTDNTESVYVGPISFTTDIACEKVNIVFVNGNKPNTIAIEYHNLNNNSTTEIEYGIRGFEIGTGIKLEETNGEFIYKEISNLQSGVYDLYIRANCGNDGYSDYTLATVSVHD